MNTIDMMLRDATWTPIEPPTVMDGSVYATHSGVLTIEGLKLKCWQLSDGRRMIDAQSIAQLFGFDSPQALADSIAQMGNQELAERLRKPMEFNTSIQGDICL